MTKKEIIIKAWMDLNIETPFGICDKTGWVHGYFCNGIDDIINDYGNITDKIDYDIDMSGVGKFRPKSLQGIENNNGWFILNNVAKEIPIEIDNIELYNINTGEYYISTDTHEFIEIGRFTHWKPLEKSKYPLF